MSSSSASAERWDGGAWGLAGVALVIAVLWMRAPEYALGIATGGLAGFLTSLCIDREADNLISWRFRALFALMGGVAIFVMYFSVGGDAGWEVQSKRFEAQWELPANFSAAGRLPGAWLSELLASAALAWAAVTAWYAR